MFLFKKKYSQTLNPEQLSIIYSNQKFFITFYNVKNHENNFALSFHKLLLLIFRPNTAEKIGTILQIAYLKFYLIILIIFLMSWVKSLLKFCLDIKIIINSFQKSCAKYYKNILKRFMGKNFTVRIKQYRSKSVLTFFI